MASWRDLPSEVKEAAQNYMSFPEAARLRVWDRELTDRPPEQVSCELIVKLLRFVGLGCDIVIDRESPDGEEERVVIQPSGGGLLLTASGWQRAFPPSQSRQLSEVLRGLRGVSTVSLLAALSKSPIHFVGPALQPLWDRLPTSANSAINDPAWVRLAKLLAFVPYASSPISSAFPMVALRYGASQVGIITYMDPPRYQVMTSIEPRQYRSADAVCRHVFQEAMLVIDTIMVDMHGLTLTFRAPSFENPF